MNSTGPNFNMATLYVGDLHPDVSESMLFSKFSTAGPVASIHVCRDMITKRSLGYAYVNFSQPADAKRAMSTMEHDIINVRPIRIKWVRNEDLEDTNLFIKNLDKSVDNKALYDTFSAFGNILSCKIAAGDQGSKGYGFVHFETEEAAKQAIEKVNGMLLNGKKVYVEKFIPRRERLAMMGDKAKKYNNVYIKNFGEEYDDDKLKVEMEKFGKVISAKVMTDQQNISRGFGFACFEDPEDAENVMGDGTRSKGFGFVCFSSLEEATKAVTEMNGKLVFDRPLYVALAQRKEDRRAHLAFQYMQHITTMRQQQTAQYSQMFRPFGAGYFVPQHPQTARGFFTPTQMPQVQASPRWQAQVRQPAPGGASFQAVQGNQLRPARFQGSGQQSVRANMIAPPINGQAGGQPGGQRMVGPGIPQGPPGATPWREAVMFDDASPTKQRQMLGNRVFPLIINMYPDLACKLTEMLLEIDKSELLYMLESPKALRDEVENAVLWLKKRHQSDQPEQS